MVVARPAGLKPGDAYIKLLYDYKTCCSGPGKTSAVVVLAPCSAWVTTGLAEKQHRIKQQFRGRTIVQIQRITTAAIAAAGLSFAGLGAFAAMPASAATTAIGHPIKHPIKALAKCHVKGQLGWTVAGKRYLCEKPAGWHFYRWVAHPMAKPKPPVPAPTPKQQLQAWADASGNADWYQVVKTDTNRLVNDESTSPVTCNLLDSCSTVTYDVPSGGLQTLIAADALTLVTDARSAVADAPPGNLTASWDAFMNGQVVYGQHINADPANWFTYTFSPAAGNAVVAAAVTDGLVGIYLLGPPNAPTPGIPTP